MRKYIDVAIPAHNEEGLIEMTLRSIYGQTPSDRYIFAFTVVANGCTDNTVKIAKETIGQFKKRPDQEYRVIEQSVTGKARAINTILSKGQSDILIYADADVTFSESCFEKVADDLVQEGAVVSGATPDILIPESIKNTEIGHLHRAWQLYINRSQTTPAPIGRMLGFRRSLLDKLPENIAAEDKFIALSAMQQFGYEQVRSMPEAIVYSVPPKTIQEAIKQTARNIAAMNQLFNLYPELRKVREEELIARGKYTHSEPSVIEDVKHQLKEEGIDPHVVDQMRALIQQAEERGDKSPELISNDGRWEPILSTKSS